METNSGFSTHVIDTISTSFDNLFNMANGTVSADKLFVNGQMKVDGNISKGAEMRYLLGKGKM